MKKGLFWKGLILGIIILFVGAYVIPSTIGMVKFFYKNTSNQFYSENEITEYWALIFAVGVYKNAWEKDIPEMIVSANLLYEVLINSSNWHTDHIHMVIGEKATGRRLIKELLWLIRNNNRNDMSLVYITTHGGPLIDPQGNPLDLPPKDEADGADEILAMYDYFDNGYAFIWDDLLNFFLSMLQSKGVCLIVDSCYAGGFNDPPIFTQTSIEGYTAESFTQGFAEELSTQNRVVLMACQENEESYGIYFSRFLIDGLWGGGDFWNNNDGINSAEEAFNYADYWVKKRCDFTPAIFDLYPGEYPVTFSKCRVSSGDS
jgi:hypothetical protein